MNSRKLSHKLDELKKMIQDAVVSRVVEDFVDINTPLKQFTDAVHVPKGKHWKIHLFHFRVMYIRNYTLILRNSWQRSKLC